MELCRVADCDHSRAPGRRMCWGHLSRKRRHGDLLPNVPLRDPSIDRDDCCVDGCNRARMRQANGSRSSLCGAHRGRKYKSGDVMAAVPVGFRPEPASYEAMHQALRSRFGSASSHECACGDPASQWAYQHDDPSEQIELRRDRAGIERRVAWSPNVDCYKPMCLSCHITFDKALATH